MRVAIIGAGAAGMAAAHDLIKAGHNVTIFEAGERVGGLAAGFKDVGWDWELEKFYHHWFQSDKDILGLIAELGLSDKVLFLRPKTSMWSRGRPYQLDGAISALFFPHLPLFPKIRFGFVGLSAPEQELASMERFSAEEWLIKTMGKTAYETLWRPMLIGKFGDLYRDVPMSWFWARVHVRSVKLGTFEGGFQRFLDLFAASLQQRGVTICLKSPVKNIRREGDALKVTVGEVAADFDAVISTSSPAVLLKLAPDLAAYPDYADKLRNLRSMGAVVLVLALKHQLLTDGTYWLNLPASNPDKAKSEFPFVGLFEHTNYMDPRHYGGDHIVYCGDYVPVEHGYFKLSDDALADRFIGALKTFNPDFTSDWVRKRWVFRAPYAQPVPFLNHSKNIPDLRTPIPGLYLASMSQVYPWDRGTNYAVQIGRQVAARLLAEQKTTELAV
jgi:protoporphyrinogen oxidase